MKRQKEEWQDSDDDERKKNSKNQAPKEEFICDVCGKSFNAKFNLTKHRKNVHGNGNSKK